MDHYSVPAGSFPDQVPNHIAQSRLKNLLKAGEKAFEEYAENYVGKELRVLVEKISHFSGFVIPSEAEESLSKSHKEILTTTFSKKKKKEMPTA